jgi:hypothetical protein
MQGVFGITTLTIPASDWRFPVTLVSVCIPFFVLILVLQTRAAMELVRGFGMLVEGYFRLVLGWLVSSVGVAGGGIAGGNAGGVGDRRYQHHHHHQQQQVVYPYSGSAGDGGGPVAAAGGVAAAGRAREVDTERDGGETWRRRLRRARVARRERVVGDGRAGVRGTSGCRQQGGQDKGVWSRVVRDGVWSAWSCRWPWWRVDEAARAQKDSIV